MICNSVILICITGLIYTQNIFKDFNDSLCEDEEFASIRSEDHEFSDTDTEYTYMSNDEQELVVIV